MYLRRSLRRRANLRHFVLELTPYCNQKCVYCYNVWKHNIYPTGQLDLSDWEEIILRLRKQTKVKLVSISGGEPLLYPHLYELIEFIKAQGLDVNLLTNGSLLDEPRAERLVKLGVSVFEIPLISHDRNIHRNLKGADDFDRVVEGIANIGHFGGRVVTVFVATNDNIHTLGQTMELGIVLGSRGVMFNRINPACQEHIELMPTVEDLKSAFSFLNRFGEEFSYPILCSVPVPPCVINMKNYSSISHGYCPSGNEHSYYTIDFLGNVRVCNHSPVVLGNLLEESFSEINNNAFVEKFKTIVPDDCASCQYSDICKGGCRASAQVCFGEMRDNDPFVERCRQRYIINK